jgi:hypothetical protein
MGVTPNNKLLVQTNVMKNVDLRLRRGGDVDAKKNLPLGEKKEKKKSIFNYSKQ